MSENTSKVMALCGAPQGIKISGGLGLEELNVTQI
jgi:hypothetical protein